MRTPLPPAQPLLTGIAIAALATLGVAAFGLATNRASASASAPTTTAVARAAAAPSAVRNLAALSHAIAPALVIRQTAPVQRAHTGWAALDAAIAQIPVYYPGIAHWHVADKGAWGATNLDTGDIYIAPRAPVNLLASIVDHEYGHALAGRMYGGFDNAEAVADRYFDQQGEYGLEIEADCMARVQGATWTNYTSCANATWRSYANSLVHNIKLR